MHEGLSNTAFADWLNQILFGYYPYICMAVLALGSILRFDREQYTWRSGSSQLLRRKQLVLGSVLFHVGVLFLLFGHTVGLLTPHQVYSPFISAEAKQMLAIVSGGAAGVICFVGLTLLIHRRFFDARVRRTSTFGDNAILLLLWAQLTLGLITIPYSLQHHDANIMLRLAGWAQGILTFQPGAAELVRGLDWPYQAHLVLGLTIFLIFPFTRLVHMLSVPIWFLGRRGWQLVRTRAPEMPHRSVSVPQRTPAE